MGVFGSLGHDWGAVGVEVSGAQAGHPVRRQACVVAESAGQRLPILPAAVMAGRLLSRGAAEGGLVSVDRWLSRDDLASEYPRWIQAAGFGVVAGGATLSAAAWADSATGMLFANVVLVPCLLAWLAGVAISATGMRDVNVQ